MNKLAKPIFCILLALAFCCKGFGQKREPAAVQSSYTTQQNLTVQRSPVVPHSTVVKQPKTAKRMELVKEGYISLRLKLTPEESKAFWPLYRQYVQEQTAIRILKRQNNSNTTTDGTEQIDKELAYEQQLVEIRKHYRDEFLKILPPEKVSELYKSEREFNDEVLKQLSERSIRAGN
jgi:hypothetical protein